MIALRKVDVPWSGTELAEFHGERSRLYLALWRLLREPIGREKVGTLRSQLAVGTRRVEAAPPFAELAQALAAVSFEELRRARALATGSSTTLCATGVPGRGTREAFAAVGLEPVTDPIDELRALGLLAKQLMVALSRADYDTASRLGELQLNLLRCEGACLRRLCVDLTRSGDALLASVAGALDWLIEHDRRYLDAGGSAPLR